MPVKILFCSQDRYFGDHLNLALSEDPRSFQVLYFTDSQRAVDFLERSGEEVQCILGSPRFLRLTDPADGLQIALGEETSLEAPLTVNMYQRRQDLVDDLKNILRANDLLAAASVRHSSTKILSFFSTQGGSGKTTLALSHRHQGGRAGKDRLSEPGNRSLCGAAVYPLRYSGSGGIHLCCQGPGGPHPNHPPRPHPQQPWGLCAAHSRQYPGPAGHHRRRPGVFAGNSAAVWGAGLHHFGPFLHAGGSFPQSYGAKRPGSPGVRR